MMELIKICLRGSIQRNNNESIPEGVTAINFLCLIDTCGISHIVNSLYHQHPRGKTVRLMASYTVLNGQSLDHPIRKYTSAGWVSPTASRAVQQQAAR